MPRASASGRYRFALPLLTVAVQYQAFMNYHAGRLHHHAIRQRRPLKLLIICLLIAGLTLAACARQPAANVSTYQPEILAVPAQLENFAPMAIPLNNPLTPEKIALGRQLFFDQRLSADGARSCASCHTCENGLADGATSTVGARSSPSLWNIGYHQEFNWDGRSPSLEAQAQTIWRDLMGAQNREAEIIARLNAVAAYQEQFRQVFGAAVNAENIAQAIAAYERTFISGNDETPFDRWQAGDEAAVSEQVKRGYQVFQQARCDQCHSSVLFTDIQYHNVGIGTDTLADKLDQGRLAVLKDLSAEDPQRAKFSGAFKTPTLRDVARSAPYFHDGSVATLAEAVEVMIGGGRPNKNLDAKLQRSNLTAPQKDDLLEFLRALSNDKCRVTAPQLP